MNPLNLQQLSMLSFMRMAFDGPRMAPDAQRPHPRQGAEGAHLTSLEAERHGSARLARGPRP